MKFIDYTNAETGLLVKRSDHQREQQCLSPASPEQLGILTDKRFVEEDGSAICYPVVFWEGSPMERICHPVNVTPVRESTLPYIEQPEVPYEN